MNPTALEEALLLRDSGELDSAGQAELEAALLADPALRAKADEWRRLQDAGPWASRQTTPALADLQRERILRAAARPAPRILPRLLAAAALFMLGVGLWPHLAGRWNSPAENLVTISPPTDHPVDALLALEIEFPELDNLEAKLSLIAAIDPGADLAASADADVWANELLALEESI